MFNPRSYEGVLLDMIKSERLVILGPILFINFFAVGYVLHGVVFSFKALELSQIIISVTLSVLVFFGQMVLLLLPMKVLVDQKISPALRRDKEIIRLSFEDQDREVFRKVKLASNSLMLILTGFLNYILIMLFSYMWYSNDGAPIPASKVVDALIPFYGFLFILTFAAVGIDLVRGDR